jgi:hypothetical protein
MIIRYITKDQLIQALAAVNNRLAEVYTHEYID